MLCYYVICYVICSVCTKMILWKLMCKLGIVCVAFWTSYYVELKAVCGEGPQDGGVDAMWVKWGHGQGQWWWLIARKKGQLMLAEGTVELRMLRSHLTWFHPTLVSPHQIWSRDWTNGVSKAHKHPKLIFSKVLYNRNVSFHVFRNIEIQVRY